MWCSYLYSFPSFSTELDWNRFVWIENSGVTASMFLCSVHVYTIRNVSEFNLFVLKHAQVNRAICSLSLSPFTYITSRCSHAIDKSIHARWISCFWSYAHIRPLIITRQSISLSAMFVRVRLWIFFPLHPFYMFCAVKHISAIEAKAHLRNVAIHLSTMMMTLMMVLIK